MEKRQSTATKAIKRKEAAKAKREGNKVNLNPRRHSLLADTNSHIETQVPAGAPKPEKVYNDELKNNGLEIRGRGDSRLEAS